MKLKSEEKGFGEKLTKGLIVGEAEIIGALMLTERDRDNKSSDCRTAGQFITQLDMVCIEKSLPS